MTDRSTVRSGDGTDERDAEAPPEAADERREPTMADVSHESPTAGAARSFQRGREGRSDTV